ncbi:ABC transporter permease [Streptomyces sp. SPB162]|uniref:ABC transporter permease n=1 Tax=Streptomyces sp. SPB162 TaxID=2940560 RepID=UPI0024063AC3|nr:ABC transporter permease [Streptomyces sp. SPB162]MDF9813619.1 putative ABC transport system permease protein [Streptomyces sp. SPB162]
MTVFKTSMRNFVAHKGRMVLSAVAVLLSVAFVCGTLVFTDTMTATFDKLFASTASDVSVSAKKVDDAQETGKPETVPASMLAKLQRTPGVQQVEAQVVSDKITVVNSKNESVGSKTGAPTIAINWDERDSKKSVELTSGHLPRGPSEALLDADTADKKSLKIGDSLRIIATPGDFSTRIVGIVTFKTTNPGAAIVYLDTPTAQTKLLGATDAYTEFGLTAKSGVSDDQLKKDVTAAVGTGYKIQTAAESNAEAKDDIGSFLNPMKYIMLGFAFVSVIVGVFLIINTFSMLVAQRTREIGLMRAIGSSRKQINQSVLFEALLLGVLGSVLGIGGGIGLAVLLMKLMGKLGMHLDTSELTIKVATPIIGLSIGVIVTVLAALLPAWRAGKISPMAAMRDAGTPADGKAGKVRATIGALMVLAGAAALVAAGKADKASQGSSFLGFGVLLTLIGFVIVGPLLASVLVRALSTVSLRFFGPVGRLAERNALRNPRRTGATASALMIGLALVAGLSVVGTSMVASATDQLDKSVGADFILQTDNQQPLSPALTKAIHSAGHLEHVTDYTGTNAKLTTPDGKVSAKQLTAASPTYAQDLRVEAVQGKLSDAYGDNSMSVNEGFAKDHGITLGSELTVAFVGGETGKLKVAAITSDDTTFDKGAMYTNIATAKRFLPAGKFPPNQIMFAKAVNGQAKEAAASLKEAVKGYPQLTVRDQSDYKELIKGQVNQLLYMIYGLLGLAIVVAILGVVNTLALSVVERTREIGLMRAIGMSRRQLRRMVRLESVVIALFGALVGLGLGMGWGISAQRLMATVGFGVLEIPWGTIIVVFIGSAFVGLVAALVPAFRAGRMNVLKAIATD